MAVHALTFFFKLARPLGRSFNVAFISRSCEKLKIFCQERSYVVPIGCGPVVILTAIGPALV